MHDRSVPRWVRALICVAACAAGETAHASAQTAAADYQRAVEEHNRCNYTLARKLVRSARADPDLPKNLVELAAKLEKNLNDLISRIELTVSPEKATVLVDGRPLEDSGSRSLAGQTTIPVLVAGAESPGPAHSLPESKVIVELDKLTVEAVLLPKKHRLTISAVDYKDRTVEMTSAPEMPDKLSVSLCPSQSLLDQAARRPDLLEDLKKTHPQLDHYLDPKRPDYKADCLYEDALEAKREDKLSEAITLLEGSLKLAASPKASYALGNFLFDAQEYVKALKAFDNARALKDGLSKAELAHLEEREKWIQARIGLLEIHVSPEGATIQVDDAPLETRSERCAKDDARCEAFAGTRPYGAGESMSRPQFTVLALNGTRKLVFTYPDYEPLEILQPVAQRTLIEVKLTCLPLKWSGLGLVITGSATVVLGLATGGAAWRRASTADGQCSGNLCSPDGMESRATAKTLADFSSFLVGFGSLGAGAGAALLGTWMFRSSYKILGQASPAFALKPQASGLMLEGTW